MPLTRIRTAQCIGRRFVIERIVHSGDGSLVVAARDRLDDEPCALKIATGRDRGQGRAQRLEAEYRILADLRHPGIPRALDFGMDAECDVTYLATELIPGSPLSECGGLLPSHAFTLFTDVLRTLTYLHDRQILHFDVKPANLIQDARRDRTVLIDFDLARRYGGATGRGTAPFVAPEVLGLGGPVDARADLYSLAATFVTLLGGNVPSADEPGELQLPAFDHPMIGLLGEMLARDVASRPEDGRAVFARLRELGFDAPDETGATARARIRHPQYLARESLEMKVLEEIPAVRGRWGLPGVVALKGPLGVGKTRLVDRLKTSWRAAGVRVLEGRVGQNRGGTLGPIRDLLRQAARMEKGPGEDPAAGTNDRLGIFDRFAQELLKLGRKERTVLIFDGVNRFDRSSRDFLVHFLRQVSDEGAPQQEGGLLKVLLTYEPAELHDDPLRAWLDAEADSGVLIVPVDPLTEPESLRFVQQISQPRTIDGATTASLVARAGGIPLVLREWVAAWLEEARSGKPDPDAMPASVEALIRRRLDHLPPEERRLLDLVALFPDGAPRDVLARISEGAAIDGPLATLLAREELAEQSGKISLTGVLKLQVLSQLRSGEAARIHALIAQSLGQTGGSPEEISYHLLKAGDEAEGVRLAYDVVPMLRDAGLEEEAVRLLSEVRTCATRHAGARRWAALLLVDLWLASGQIAKAHAALVELAERSRTDDPAIAIRLARVAFREGDHVAARAALDGVLALDRELSDDDRADLLIELCEILHALGHHADARDALDRATPFVDDAVPESKLQNEDVPIENVRGPRFVWPGESASRVGRYLLVRGDLERSAGRLVAALKCQLAALKVVSRLHDTQGIGRVSHALGTVYMTAVRHDLAEQWFVRALPVRREAGDLVGVADTANNLGVLMRKAKRSTEAIEHFTMSLRLRRQVGHVAGEGYAYLNIANVYYERRELDAANRYYQRALLVARRLRDPRSQAQVLNNLGAVAQLRYRLEEAIRCYEEAEVLFRLVGDVHGAMARWLNLADLEIVVGDLDEADHLLRVVERLNRRRLHGDVATRLILLRSRWRRARGEIVEALLLLRQAAERPDVQPELLEEIRIDLAFTEIENAREDSALDLARTISEGAVALEAPPLVAIIRGLAALKGSEEVVRQACIDVLDTVRFASNGRMTGLKFLANRVLGSLYRELNERPRALNAFLDGFEALETIALGFSDPVLLNSWMQTRPVVQFTAELEGFLSEVSKGRAGGPGIESHEVLRRLKDTLFDAERSIGPIHREAQKRGESIRRILQIARALSSTAPVDELLRQVVDGVIDFSGAERAFIVLVDDRGRLRIPVARDQEREAIAAPEQQISRRIVDEVLRRKTSLRFDNAMTEGSLTSAASVANLELRSVMCAPLLAGARVFGLLYVDNRSKTGHFSDVDLDLLDIFAVQVAIALENAKLVREFVRDEKLKVMGNLTGGVAHDFNNLLAAILGRVQDLLSRASDASFSADLRTIETAAKDGAVIVRRLQDFTRVRREAEFIDVEVSALVDDVVEFTRSRWQGAMLRSGDRIEIVRDVPRGIFVRGHPAELREVFTNIVLNAITAMPEGGRLSLSASAAGQKVTVCIADSGIGMSEEVRESIFDPYFTTRGGDGMGLGMSIVYGIVARHQGTLRVESRLGEGTRIFVDLPRTEEQPAAKPREARKSRTSKKGRRVLVVEDEPGVRAVVRDILKGAGFEIEDTGGGREALAAFAARPADVVLTDLGMVPMNGWDVAQAIKGLDPTTSVILVTGWGAEIDIETARAMKVDFLLRKPFDLANLVSAVDEAGDLTDSKRKASLPTQQGA